DSPDQKLRVFEQGLAALPGHAVEPGPHHQGSAVADGVADDLPPAVRDLARGRGRHFLELSLLDLLHIDVGVQALALLPGPDLDLAALGDGGVRQPHAELADPLLLAALEVRSVAELQGVPERFRIHPRGLPSRAIWSMQRGYRS